MRRFGWLTRSRAIVGGHRGGGRRGTAIAPALLAATFLSLTMAGPVAAARTPVARGADLPALPEQPRDVAAARASLAVPSSIDATGSTDVARELQAFLDRVPDGATVEFPRSARYRLDRGLDLSGRHGLTLLGRGTRLMSSGCSTSDSVITMGGRAPASDITIRGFTLVGDHADAGTRRAYAGGCEYQMGILIYRSQRIAIVDTRIRRVHGDCVYVGGGGSPWTWSSDITFRQSSCRFNGRMGVAITAGRRVLVEDSHFGRLAYLVFDIEPNTARDGAMDITFRGNRIGRYGHTDRYTPYLFAANGDRGAVVDRVLVSRNRVYRGALRALVEVEPGQARNRRNITYRDNVSRHGTDGPVAFFRGVDGLTIEDNRQALRSGYLASVSRCTSVVVD